MSYRAGPWASLCELSDDDVIARHDALVEGGRVTTSVNYYLEELRHRRQSRIADRVECLTWCIAGMTLVVTIATLVNVVLVFRTSP